MKPYSKFIIALSILIIGPVGIAMGGYTTYTPITQVTITSHSDYDVVFAGGKYTVTCTTSTDKDCDETNNKVVSDPVVHTWSGPGTFSPTTGTSVTWTAPCTTGDVTITVTASDDSSPVYANDTDKSDSVILVVQDVIYVDTDAAAGNNDGTTWANAFTDLQDALDVASSCSEIWVGEGTYIPADPNVFTAMNGANIYGGFDATETARSQRDWTSNETVLSGDMGIQGNDNDNSPCVLYVDTSTGSIVVDGFTVTKGRNSGGIPAGMALDARSGSVTVSHCVLSDNESAPDGWGGAMVIYSDDSDVENCVFVDNSAKYGGAVACILWSSTFTNCTFTANHATDGGGAVYTIAANATITNCILWGDTADANDDEIYNDWFGGSATVTYSDIEGGYAGTGNLNCDPNFLDDTDPDGNDDAFMTSDDGLVINDTRAIDAANGNVDPTADILGNSRYDDANWSNIGIGTPVYVDMGAYEYQGT